MREKRTKILQKDVFTLSVREIEQGERPGWYVRKEVQLDGEEVMMRFEIETSIHRWRAKWEIIKVRATKLLQKNGP